MSIACSHDDASVHGFHCGLHAVDRITSLAMFSSRTHYTVEPLSNDHPHQQPSFLYDHISCDGQCFLGIRSLSDDHPSNATSDQVRWNFLPRERLWNECLSDRVQHILHIIPIGGVTQTNTKIVHNYRVQKWSMTRSATLGSADSRGCEE